MKNLDVHKDLEISAHDIRRLQEQGRITIDILQVGLFLQTLVYHSRSCVSFFIQSALDKCMEESAHHVQLLKPAFHATSPSHAYIR